MLQLILERTAIWLCQMWMYFAPSAAPQFSIGGPPDLSCSRDDLVFPHIDRIEFEYEEDGAPVLAAEDEAEAKERKCKFLVRHGDVVEMWGKCQHKYQHSIRTEAEADLARPRISLVYKRTLRTERERSAHERAEWASPAGAWAGWR